jgi:AraC-like DNA-binding protein/quercetin dioxygenase-like cupin family protein
MLLVRHAGLCTNARDAASALKARTRTPATSVVRGLIESYDPKPGVSIATLAWDYRAGFEVPEHAHGSDQLVYATHGVMELSAGQSFWLIPPHFAIWIPAGTRHRIRMPAQVAMRTLYVRPRLAAGLPGSCTVFPVTPLLRELIVEAVRLEELRAGNRLHRAVRDLILAQLRNAEPVPTRVNLPRDGRALAVAQALMENPARGTALHALCARAGASVRTIERIFRAEVGMDFESWRRQVRLMKGIELLVEGRQVKEVAFATGYRQPSAFVQMFRRTMGATPKAWLEIRK